MASPLLMLAEVSDSHRALERREIELLGDSYYDYLPGTPVDEIMEGRSKSVIEQFSILALDSSGDYIWVGTTAITAHYPEDEEGIATLKIGRTLVASQSRGLGVARTSKLLIAERFPDFRLRSDVHYENRASEASLRSVGFELSDSYWWDLSTKCPSSSGQVVQTVAYNVWLRKPIGQLPN